MVGLLLAVAAVTFGAPLVGGPLADLLAALPGVGSSPTGRTRAVGGLALAVLAVVGLQGLLRPARPPGVLRRVVLLLGTGAVLLVAALTLAFAAREAAASTETGWALVRPVVPARGGVGRAVVLVALAVLAGLRRTTTVLASNTNRRRSGNYLVEAPRSGVLLGRAPLPVCRAPAGLGRGVGRRSPIAKQVAVSSTLQTIDAYARAASAAGGFDHGNSHLTRTALRLDARGWNDLSRACMRLLAQVDRIEEASAERMERNPHAGETRTSRS